MNIKFSNYDPPYPKWLALPIVGHFYPCNFLKAGEEIYKLSKTQYGLIENGIYSIWVGDIYGVILTNTEIIKELFSIENTDYLLNRPSSISNDLITSNKRTLSGSLDYKWLPLRGKISHIFTNKNLRKNKFNIENRTKEMINHLSNSIKQQGPYHSVKLWKYSKTYLLNTFYEHLNSKIESFETTFESQESQLLIKNIYTFIVSVFGLPDITSNVLSILFSIHHIVTGLKPVKKYHNLIKKLILDPRIDEINNNTNGTYELKNNDLLNSLLIYNESLPIKEQTELNIIVVIMDFLNAGIITNSMTLEWFMLLLSNRPEIQDMLYDELVSVARDGFIDIGCKDKTPILNSVLKEVVRFKMGSFGVPRVAKKELKVRDYIIAKGATVVYYNYSLFNDPNYWGDNVNEFDPKRFIKNPEFIERLSTQFGISSRGCPGKNLSNDQTYLFCSNMILNFKWVPSKYSNHWSDQTKTKLSEKSYYRLNSFPYPFSLSFKNRN